MIQCKENKCLKYPACVNKTSVKCLLLENYAYDVVQSGSSFWYEIREILPNLTYIKTEGNYNDSIHEKQVPYLNSQVVTRDT